METKINTAEILKNVPIGTKLYSPLFGNVYLTYIGEMFITVRHHSTTANFHHNGRLYNYEGTEPMLFPSREMRDWSKFAWKKGDVLTNNSGFKIFFDKWVNDDYTKFFGKIKLLGDSHCYDAAFYNLVPEEKALEFIKSVEEINNGKLNRETLEIEKFQPEFMDGDIAFADYGNRQDVFIVSDKTDLSEGYSSFISLDLSSLTLSMGCRTSFFKKDLCKLRLATEEEKKQLFLALEKKGKVWDADKKMIVDLKPKVELKPFDKVLGRNEKGDVWEAELFSHYREESQYPFRCIGFSRKYCIPYNEETAHLLGTTDDWEGSEG